MPEFWLPPSFTKERPRYACNLCGHKEHTPEAQLRHIRRCYGAHEAEVRSMSMRERAPGLFGDRNVDVEFEQWHRSRGITE